MERLHPAASEGFTAKASAYALGRPSYPAAIDRWLRRDLALAPGRLAVDLGAGTGKFTACLLATGCAVAAVEPVAAMRHELRAAHPHVEAIDGSAQHIPLADDAADAVVCAQSFHWFATREALAEIRRVLRPGSALGLVWNVRDETVGWVAALGEILRPHEGDAPRFQSGDWRSAFPAEGFGPLRSTRMRNDVTGEPERVIVDRVLSVSYIARLPEEDHQSVARQVRELIEATPELRGRCNVTLPYETLAFDAVKTF